VPVATTLRAAGHSQIIAPAVLLDWFWLPVELIPRPRASKHEPEQRNAYIAQVGDRRVRDVLEALLRELEPYLSAGAKLHQTEPTSADLSEPEATEQADSEA
jgi:hypothetical protein